MAWVPDWLWRRRRVRSRRVGVLAEGAVLDDPMFAPETVEGAARWLHDEIVAAWTAEDRRRLAAALGRELYVEWERRLDELRRRRLRNTVQRRGRLRVRYVGLRNRAGEAQDRVVVHVRARLRDALWDQSGRMMFRDSSDNGKRTRSEYWTLGKRDDRWVLLSVEGDREGAYHLAEPIESSPWEDERLHDDAVIERGVKASARPDFFSEVAADVPFEFAGNTRMAALDLAGLDGRWAPDVLEAAARRAVAAWAEAIDGHRQPLIDLAGRHTANQLLYPEPHRRSRIVIRGPHLDALRILSLRPAARPPSMTIEAAIDAYQYIESRSSGVVLSGSKTRRRSIIEQWDLVLTHNRTHPWRIAGRHQPRANVIKRILDEVSRTAMRIYDPNLRPRPWR